MLRSRIIISILLYSTIANSQALTFDKAIQHLFFGVDITRASGSLVDSFMAIKDLHHRDTVIRQSSLGTALEMEADKQTWSSRHEFTFSKSPLEGETIKAGKITVKIGENGEIKKLLDISLIFEFENKKDAEVYFINLKNMFRPLSTKQKKENTKFHERILQYSTRPSGSNGVKDITIILNKSLQTHNFEILVLLMSEFINE